MATNPIYDLNRNIKKSANLLAALENPDFQVKLQTLDISWKTGMVAIDSELYQLFLENELINLENGNLNKSGILFCGRIFIDFESELNEKGIFDNKFQIIRKIQIGKNSCTFLAEHIILGTQVVLKFIRPGASDNIREALKKISNSTIPHLVSPWDYFKVEIKDVFSKAVEIECIVYPYISGDSLKGFLFNYERPLNAHAIASFIKQVGSVLAYLESIGAYHGDLHSENIIVNTGPSGQLSFNVIDVSYGITGSMSSEECKNNDLELFRQHVWSFLSTQQRFLAKMSIRKYLGSEIFYIVSAIMSPEKQPFKIIMDLFDNNYNYQNYRKKKLEFIEQKFKKPGSFKLQRYEEITDQTVALRLFVPFPEVMTYILAFSNLVIAGNRGTGKSTYLAAIAFFPHVSTSIVDYRDIFGIYFPCRQGEFRLLSSDMIDYHKVGSHRVKHVMILKIIRRTLETLAEGIELKKITDRSDYSIIKKQLSVFLEKDEIISIDRDVVTEIRNLVSIMVRIEMKELDNLFKAKPFLGNRLTSEIDVLRFFQTIQVSFSELTNSRFHLLFDDAGRPNMPTEIQYIINDLIISSNPVFCVKLTTEKYSYEFQTTSSKVIESGHDFSDIDLNKLLFTGPKTQGLEQSILEKYFKQIIERRLDYFEYQSTNIIDYLGDDQAKVQSLINSLSNVRRNAYYCGWTMTSRIADKVPRNLLELISEIFSVGNVDKDSKPALISNRHQDRAIKAVSEKRLRSLSQISGTIDILGEKVSLGRKLFEITSAIGSVFRIYLVSERGKDRKDQYLAIERDDFSNIDLTVENLLKESIRYGIFDDSRLDFARNDRIKKQIYILNRIYCPAFAIGLQRDQHLRLSRGKFEELFSSPQKFVKDGTHRLRVFSSSDKSTQQNLFNDLIS